MNANFRLLLACSLSCAPALFAADLISLKDGSTLRGTVRLIDQHGTVVLDSTLSAKPIRLKGEALRSINFDIKATALQNHSELLHLTNGDILPGTLKSLDHDKLTFHTWYAGEVTLERKFAQAIDFGVSPQKMVYQGPKGLSEWSSNDDWEFENGNFGIWESNSRLPDARIPDFPNSQVPIPELTIPKTRIANSQLPSSQLPNSRIFNSRIPHSQIQYSKFLKVDEELMKLDELSAEVHLTYVHAESLKRIK